jgi:hypothetical protein
MRIAGVGCTQDGLGMKSRLPVSNRLTCLTWRQACVRPISGLGGRKGLYQRLPIAGWLLCRNNAHHIDIQ